MAENITLQDLINKWMERLPSYYNTESTTTNYKFGEGVLQNILTLIKNIEEYDNNGNLTNGLKATIFVSTATGLDLEQIGAIFRIKRNGNETDSSLRTRILSHWSGITGGGTIESIKETINRIIGIPIEDIDVLENLNIAGETFTYNTGTDDYELNHNSLIIESDSLTGLVSASPYTFIREIDYNIDRLSGIVSFGIGGNDPDNGSTVTANYTYQDNMKIVVSANSGLSGSGTNNLALIENLIPKIKAAGVFMKAVLTSRFEEDIGTLVDNGETISVSTKIFANWHSASDSKVT